MTVITSEQIIPCDIDFTLLMWGMDIGSGRVVKFRDPYEGVDKQVRVHEPNLKVLVDRLERGATIIVWSASGYRWALEALKALDINHPNIYVASKPIAYIDDKKCEAWMGEQVFLPIDCAWGQGK